jgi:hypothetical protein
VGVRNPRRGGRAPHTPAQTQHVVVTPLLPAEDYSPRGLIWPAGRVSLVGTSGVGQLY